MEVISSGFCQFAVVSFERAPGHRLPDKGYKYRDGASIDEYYLNWGSLDRRQVVLPLDDN